MAGEGRKESNQRKEPEGKKEEKKSCVKMLSSKGSART